MVKDSVIGYNNIAFSLYFYAVRYNNNGEWMETYRVCRKWFQDGPME